MNKIQHIGTVVSNKKVNEKYNHIRIDAGPISVKAKPGQFVHLKIDESGKPFFRRPFSIHRAGKYLEIFYEILGEGTEKLSLKRKNDKIDILGPLGNSFRMPSKAIKKVVMIAGGMGIAPFLMLTDFLKKRKGLQLNILYGARTKEYVFNMREYKKNGCGIFISTDDGSVGVKGKVSCLYDKVEMDQKTFIYTCGPKPMIKSVQQLAGKYGIKGQASCEEVMACGLGVCRGCAIQLTSGIKMVCHDGPVFGLDEIVFN